MQLGLTHLVLVFFFLLLLFSSFRFSHKQWAVTDVQIEVKEVVSVEERKKKNGLSCVCKSRQHRVLDSRTHTIRKKERGRGGWSSDGKAIYWKASQPEGEGEKKKKTPQLVDA